MFDLASVGRGIFDLQGRWSKNPLLRNHQPPSGKLGVGSGEWGVRAYKYFSAPSARSTDHLFRPRRGVTRPVLLVAFSAVLFVAGLLDGGARSYPKSASNHDMRVTLKTRIKQIEKYQNYENETRRLQPLIPRVSDAICNKEFEASLFRVELTERSEREGGIT